MLINRKRSYRRGPTYQQTYVPHDQRQLNTQPTPIMDEKTAQYYLNQLSQMGYIQQQPPYIVTIKCKDPEELVSFEILQDLTLGTHGNINSDNMKLLDIYGNPYSSSVISNENILNRVGVKLYPIIANGSLGVYNSASNNRTIYFNDTEDFSSGISQGVPPTDFYYFSNSQYDQIKNLTRALVSANGNKMHYTAYKPNYPESTVDVMYCSANVFYLICEELTVLVYPA